MSFEEKLAIGRVSEGLIAKWLQSRGSAVLPAYEIEKHCGKGPQLFSAHGDFIAPDMLTFSHNGICWIEAKHKTVFTWHRLTDRWTTGIDLHHYGEYFKVLWKTKIPVWLLFYHSQSEPWVHDKPHCPKECPVGLFGRPLLELITLENHRTLPLNNFRDGVKGHGRTGMVYWAHQSLMLLASRDDVQLAQLHSMPRAISEARTPLE